jgi:hypothetical protein
VQISRNVAFMLQKSVAFIVQSDTTPKPRVRTAEPTAPRDTK